jgi:hypothetical protein
MNQLPALRNDTVLPGCKPLMRLSVQRKAKLKAYSYTGKLKGSRELQGALIGCGRASSDGVPVIGPPIRCLSKTERRKGKPAATSSNRIPTGGFRNL